jgi:DNA-binding transcriptional LysR family regulator
MDWEDARYFFALAKTLNLERAAESLQSSSATVMRRVKALETTLGATLFVRSKVGHQLTRVGHRFKAAVEEAGAMLDNASQEVFNQDRLVSGTVRISTTEVAAQWILLPALLAHPRDESMSIEIDVNPQPLSLGEELDTIAIRFQRPVDKQFVVKKLASVRFSLYRRRPKEISDVRANGVQKSERTVIRGEPYDYVGWSQAFENIRPERWLRERFPGAEPRLRLSSIQAHLDTCTAGFGMAALPEFIADKQPLLEKVATLPGELPSTNSFSLDAWLVMPARMRHLERVKRANRFVQAAFDRQFA